MPARPDKSRRLSSSTSSSSSSSSSNVLGKQRAYLDILDFETREFSGLTTCHGLVRIYNSNTWPSRCFWSVVVLSCLSLFMIHCGYLLFGYHSRPTLLQVNVRVKPSGLLLPDATLCPTTPVLSTRLPEWKMPSPVLRYLLRSFLERIDQRFYRELNDDAVAYANYTQNYLERTGRPFNMTDFFMQTGARCTDILRKCWWAETVEECCAENDSIRMVFTELGQCVRVRGRAQPFAGHAHGWQLLVHSLTHLRPAELPSRFWAWRGVRVALSSANQPLASPRKSALLVGAATAAHLAIHVTTIRYLSRTDWGVCEPSWPATSPAPVFLPYNYTASHCRLECRLRAWFSACGCVPLALRAHLPISPVCEPLKMSTCQQRAANESGRCTCAVECERTEYSPLLSAANLNTAHPTISRHAPWSENSSSSDAVEHADLSMLHIYLRDVAYEEHEQQKQLQTADLLSNIAGSMGLFLGMSCVTLLEIFIYLFKAVWGTVNSERQRQFLAAMKEDEEERRQSLVLLEETIHEEDVDDASMAASPIEQSAKPTRKFSRRISIHPVRTSELSLLPSPPDTPAVFSANSPFNFPARHHVGVGSSSSRFEPVLSVPDEGDEDPTATDSRSRSPSVAVSTLFPTRQASRRPSAVSTIMLPRRSFAHMGQNNIHLSVNSSQLGRRKSSVSALARQFPF